MPDVPQPDSRGRQTGPVPEVESRVGTISRLRIPGLRSGFAGRLQVSGFLIASGLAVQLVTLFWNHPVSLFLFLFPGSVLVGAGVFLFLWSIVRRAEGTRRKEAGRKRNAP